MPLFLTVREVAKRHGVSIQSVRAWCRDGVIPALNVGRIWIINPNYMALAAGRFTGPTHPGAVLPSLPIGRPRTRRRKPDGKKLPGPPKGFKARLHEKVHA